MTTTQPRPTTPIVDTTSSAGAALRPVAVADVSITGGLLAERRDVNRAISIPTQYEQIEKTHRVDNFRRAAGKIGGDYVGIYFNDSDLYKWMEAACWSLATHSDPELEVLLDTAIQEIADSQRPDGYVNSYFAVERADQRWTNPDLHETYCAGHMFQAAIAHHRATGKTSFLDIARRFADHLCDTFGPEDEGKRFWADGHEEVELALIELGRATGEQRYIDQARYFIDARGHQRLPKPYGGRPREYHQDHAPIREVDEVVGHAVRQLYFTAGATDLALEDPEAGVDSALGRLWANMTGRKMYLTGGLGARWEGESFGDDFELPSDTAYSETCAAIGGAMWGWRMFLRTGDPRFIDVIERTLYNNVLAGLSLEGRHYFYQNPLEDKGEHRRSEWFGTACCPPNVARTLAQLPGYLYALDDAGGIYATLYADSDATISRPSGDVRLTQRTTYPWDGRVTVTVGTAVRFALHLRIPDWVTEAATVAVNGEPIEVAAAPGSFATVERDWANGDTVALTLPMPVQVMAVDPRVTDLLGRVAFQRGPIVYAFEAVDNGGRDVRTALVDPASEVETLHQPELLGGVTTLAVPASFAGAERGWSGGLYGAAGTLDQTDDERITLTAIPYFAWANRDPGPMAVWLRARAAL